MRKLRLFIDNKNIRCAIRFKNATINTEEKYPILLPKHITDHC